MLVLTRRAGESIMIDGRIELKVLRIKGSQVHVGIEAPQDTKIHRKEVWLRLEGDEQGVDQGLDQGVEDGGEPDTTHDGDLEEAVPGADGVAPVVERATALS